MTKEKLKNGKGKSNIVKPAVLRIENCMDCPHHSVQADPDPDDWFCDDDCKVVCTKAKKNITTACRPYNKRRECETPSWCPLRG